MSPRGRWLVLVAGAVAWLSLLSAGAADQGRQGDPRSLNDLGLEVGALQILHALRATRAQIEALQKVARETADRPAAFATSMTS